MSWTVTLKVEECGEGISMPLMGASVHAGSIDIDNTDSNGITTIVFDDKDTQYTITVSHPDCYGHEFSLFESQHADKTATVCLEPRTAGGGPTRPDEPIIPGGRECCIGSATAETSQSAENMRLNMLRDRVLRPTEIGGALLDAIDRDFYRFSPRIASDLAEDEKLRGEMLRIVIRPLLAWYGLVEALALEPGEGRQAERADAVLATCHADTAPMARATAASLDTVLRGDPLPPNAPEPFGYLALKAQETVTLPFATWAIFAPVVRAWTCAATGEDIIENAAAWLGEVPLDQLRPPASGDRLDAELALLAQGAFSSPAVRCKIGKRLARAWPHLEAELRRNGFITGDATR